MDHTMTPTSQLLQPETHSWRLIGQWIKVLTRQVADILPTDPDSLSRYHEGTHPVAEMAECVGTIVVSDLKQPSAGSPDLISPKVGN
jgi:hypothetical protein